MSPNQRLASVTSAQVWRRVRIAAARGDVDEVEKAERIVWAAGQHQSGGETQGVQDENPGDGRRAAIGRTAARGASGQQPHVA
jgi:hypothetical protein